MLSLRTHTHIYTHTHTPSGDSNLRAIFRPDDWQLDAYSSPTRAADNSSYPHSTPPSLYLSPLFSYSHHFFFLSLLLSQPPLAPYPTISPLPTPLCGPAVGQLQ